MSDPFQKRLLQQVDNGIESVCMCEEKKKKLRKHACLSSSCSSSHVAPETSSVLVDFRLFQELTKRFLQILGIQGHLAYPGMTFVGKVVVLCFFFFFC